MSNLPFWLDDQWIQRIVRSLEGLEYGSVQIIVHDSKITQIERLEKKRFPLEKDNPLKERFRHVQNG